MDLNPGPRIGLTGGIGSGKSTVAAVLVKLGAQLIDTDAIARQLTLPDGAAVPALRVEFGEDIVDARGALDRQRMRKLVFSSVAARKRLESILHPLIGAEASRQAMQVEPDRPLVFDVPLLAESRHWRARCDRILVVDCSSSIQIKRVMQRSGWSADQVRAVVEQQASSAVRRTIADAVIFNDGLDLDALASQVGALWHLWVQSRNSLL